MSPKTKSAPPEEVLAGLLHAMLYSTPVPCAPRAITIWRYADAPECMRALHETSGDEDWLALVPPDLTEASIPWLKEGSTFGVCSVYEYEFYGWRIVVGGHS